MKSHTVNLPPTHSNNQWETEHFLYCSPIGCSPRDWQSLWIKFFSPHTLAPRSFSDGGITAAHWGEGKNRREKKGERCPIHPSIHPLNFPAGLINVWLHERLWALALSLSGTVGLLSWYQAVVIIISSNSTRQDGRRWSWIHL